MDTTICFNFITLSPFRHDGLGHRRSHMNHRIEFAFAAEYMESDFGVKQPTGVPSGVIPGVTCIPFLVEFGGHFKL
jgi:hypothetical protein